MKYCAACAKNYAWPRNPHLFSEKEKCDVCGKESLCHVPLREEPDKIAINPDPAKKADPHSQTAPESPKKRR